MGMSRQTNCSVVSALPIGTLHVVFSCFVRGLYITPASYSLGRGYFRCEVQAKSAHAAGHVHRDRRAVELNSAARKCSTNFMHPIPKLHLLLRHINQFCI